MSSRSHCVEDTTARFTAAAMKPDGDTTPDHSWRRARCRLETHPLPTDSNTSQLIAQLLQSPTRPIG